MLRLFFPLVGIGCMVFVVGVLLTPITVMLLTSASTRRRVVSVIALYCLAFMPVVGIGAYTTFPADYTLRHQLTLHPVSNTLAEIHAVDRQRIRQGVYTAAAAAAEQRGAEIAAERRAFAQDWFSLTIAGLLPPGMVLLALSALGRAKRRHRAHRRG